jgi:NhaP-type Na+/H+ and K+/H+ antiporter
MKSNRFWIRRYLLVSGIAFILLLAAALLRGRSIDTALAESFLWALVSAGILTGWRYYQARKGIACAICKDTVDGPG